MTLLTGFDLCRAAMEAPGLTAPERAVLMVLAIMADRDDATCYPPITGETGLTAKTCLSERTVQRSIQNLVKLGHISRRQLRHGCVYTVHPVLTPATVTGVSAPCDQATPATATPASPTPATATPATQAPTPATVAPKQPVTTNPDDGDAGAAPEQAITGQRGRRIDVGWQPTLPLPEAIAKVVDGWPPGRLAEVLEQFRDFWIADAGQRAAKRDWDRTWWNRLRRIIEYDREREKRHGQRPDHHRSKRGERGYRDPLLERIADGDHSALG